MPAIIKICITKITSNYADSSIESSANLLITSLKRNYEVGTYYLKAFDNILKCGPPVTTALIEAIRHSQAA